MKLFGGVEPGLRFSRLYFGGSGSSLSPIFTPIMHFSGIAIIYYYSPGGNAIVSAKVMYRVLVSK